MTQSDDKLYRQLIRAGLHTAHPSEDLCHRVLAASKTALREASNCRDDSTIAQVPSIPIKHEKRRIVRTRFGVGIAASILIAGGVVLCTWSRDRLSAAEMLQHVTEVNKAFQGWIHISSDRIPEKMQPEGGPGVKSFMLHIQPAKKTIVKVLEFKEGDRQIEWFTSDSLIMYDSKTNVLTKNTLFDRKNDPGLEKDNMTPCQISQKLFSVPTMAMDDVASLIEHGCNIQVSKQEGYDRFDLTMTEKVPGASYANSPSFLTLLVDPETKLIQKWKAIIDGDEFSLTYAYNDPVLRDIYDLGVDPSAEIVDNVISYDVNALLDLLDEKAGSFDDYDLVLTKSIVGEDGILENSQNLELTNKNIAKLIWPGRHVIDFKHLPKINIKLDVIHDNNRPGQIGLHVEETDLKQITGDDRIEWIYWLDESRDMVPVEKIETCYASNNTVSYTVRTIYPKHNCLPSGHWYPTHWQRIITVYQEGSPGPIETTNYQLRVKSAEE